MVFKNKKPGAPFEPDTQYIEIGRYIFDRLDQVNVTETIPISEIVQAVRGSSSLNEKRVRNQISMNYSGVLEIIKSRVGLTSNSDLTVLKSYINGYESRARKPEGTKRSAGERK